MPHDKIQYLVLDRRDPAANMARFYVLAIEASLFGDAALIREWGRVGTAGRRKIELYETEGGAMEALEMLAAAQAEAGLRHPARLPIGLYLAGFMAFNQVPPLAPICP